MQTNSRQALNLAVIGTGHVGLVTCAALAALGHRVVGFDQDKTTIETLRKGETPFFETDLHSLITDLRKTGRLTFVENAAEAVTDAEATFLCVGTPSRATGEVSLVAVEQAVRSVARHLRPGSVIVEKSTVPSGTAQRLAQALRLERRGLPGSIAVASNPEFLREGTAVNDSLQPDRILVGADCEEVFEVMRRIYAPLIDRGVQLIETDIATAEISKHACNAFLALKISYINAMARLCERAGADVDSVANVMGTDPRIGSDFLDAGLGFGGYCFPKDVQAFAVYAARLGYDFPVLREIERINGEAVDACLFKIQDAIWNLEGKRVALLGLAYKGGTDDTRSSPSLALARRLVAEGAEVCGYDPKAMENASRALPEMEMTFSTEDCVRDADCIVVATDWDEFKHLDLRRLHELVRSPIIVDARNILDGREVVRAGFAYHSMGKRSWEPVAVEIPNAETAHATRSRAASDKSLLRHAVVSHF